MGGLAMGVYVCVGVWVIAGWHLPACLPSCTVAQPLDQPCNALVQVEAKGRGVAVQTSAKEATPPRSLPIGH